MGVQRVDKPTFVKIKILEIKIEAPDWKKELAYLQSTLQRTS